MLTSVSLCYKYLTADCSDMFLSTSDEAPHGCITSGASLPASFVCPAEDQEKMINHCVLPSEMIRAQQGNGKQTKTAELRLTAN